MARRSGITAVISVILLTIMAALAVSYAAFANASYLQADNLAKAHSAQTQAESGLAFMLHTMREVTLPGDTTDETMMEDLRASLSDHLDSTPNLGGAYVDLIDDEVLIPLIQCGTGGFTSRFTQVDGNSCRMTVTGTIEDVSRSVSIDLDVGPATDDTWRHGIASRGKIDVGVHAIVTGANRQEEAQMLSLLAGEDAIALGLHVAIGGDLFLTDETATVDIQGGGGGGLSVGGETDVGLILSEHVHVVDPPILPTVDTTILEALATEELPDLPNYNNRTFTNVRIKPDTDPDFGQDAVLNGIVYVEAPNIVTFKSNCILNGFVVTEDGGDQELQDCQLIFKSGMSSTPVEDLPDMIEGVSMLEVKEHTGTFVLAPGFGVKFYGHANTIAGAIAADKIHFWGQAEIEVTGFILGLTDEVMALDGHTVITIDSDNADANPAGFVYPKILTPNPDSYREVTGGY